MYNRKISKAEKKFLDGSYLTKKTQKIKKKNKKINDKLNVSNDTQTSLGNISNTPIIQPNNIIYDLNEIISGEQQAPEGVYVSKISSLNTYFKILPHDIYIILKPFLNYIEAFYIEAFFQSTHFLSKFRFLDAKISYLCQFPNYLLVYDPVTPGTSYPQNSEYPLNIMYDNKFRSYGGIYLPWYETSNICYIYHPGHYRLTENVKGINLRIFSDNIIFDGSHKTIENGHLIIYDCNNIVIENINFRSADGCKQEHVIMASQVKNITIRGCKF